MQNFLTAPNRSPSRSMGSVTHSQREERTSAVLSALRLCQQKLSPTKWQAHTAGLCAGGVHTVMAWGPNVISACLLSMESGYNSISKNI